MLKFLRKAVVFTAVLGLVFGNTLPTVLVAEAAVPHIISHQGRLLDASGNLLGGAGGTEYCFRFSIYDDSALGGSDVKIWPAGSPSTMTVSVRNGVYNVGIGDTAAGGDALDFDFQSTDSAYLNIEVATKVGSTCASGDGAESFENLSPRQRIGSSGYAINSETVGGYTPAQSATGNEIPVLTGGNLELGSSAPQVNATGSNALTVQGGSGTGDVQFFSSANKITSGGALTLVGSATVSGLIVTAGGAGIDVGTAGALNLGNTNATSLSICNSAACDTVTIGSNTDADTITIGDAANDTVTINGSTVAISTGDWGISTTGALTGISLDANGTGNSVSNIEGTDILDGSISNADLTNSALTVTAGSGLTDGGSISLGGSATLNIGAGNGIAVNADDIAVRTTSSANGLSSTTSNGSGLEVLSSGLALLQGCADGEILKWNESTDVWACAADSGAGGAGSQSLDDTYGYGSTITVDTSDVTFDLADAASDYKLTINNSTAGAIATGLLFSTTGGGSIATAIDVSAANIGTALALGNNDVTVGGMTISATEFAYLDGVNAAVLDANDNAATATALAANPADCGANSFATTIAANGNLTCASITDADVPNSITVDLATLASAVTNATLTTALTVNTGTVTLVGNAANTSVLTLGAGASSLSGSSSGTNTGDQTSVTGNAGTATALAANPSDCGANTFATTIAANGNLTCASIADADVPNNITVDLATLASAVTNATLTTALTVNTGTVTLTGNAANTSVLTLGAGASSLSGSSSGTNTGDQTSVTGNAGTATALAANPSDCGPNTFATTIAANGNLTCASLTDADVPNGITVDLATLASAVTNATLTTALTVNTGTVTLVGNASNTSVLTLGSGASSLSGSSSGTNTGDQTSVTGNAGTVTFADAGGDTTTFLALGTSATGSLAPATDAGLTYNATTDTLTTTTFVGALTGNVTGNVSGSSGSTTGNAGTATALAANPADCGANTFATTIAANGNLTCASISDADVPNNITVDLATLASAVTNATLTTALTVNTGTVTLVGNAANTSVLTLGAGASSLSGSSSGTNTGDQTSVTGNAGTATALAANPTDCGANTFAVTIAANGNLTCASITDADVPNNITVDLATLASAVTNATLTTALTVNTGTVTLIGNAANTSTLTLGAGASSLSGSSSGTNTGDQTSVTGNAGTVTFADAAADTTTFVALGTNATGSLAPATDAGLTYNANTNALTATTFIGALNGNADTVTTNANLTGIVTSVGNTTAITLTSATNGLTGTSSGSGLAAYSGSLSLLQGCADGQLLKWVEATDTWDCSSDVAGGGGGATTQLDNLSAVAINTSLISDTDNTDALGSAAIGWSDLFLGSGAVINFNNGDIALTHSADTLTFTGGLVALGTATATGGLTGDVTGNLTGNVTGNVSGSSGSTTGNAATATALAANPTDCGANTFATTIAANGNLTCASITDADVPNSITVDLATLASAVTNATLTTALTVNTGTVTLVGNAANTSVLTLGAGASSFSGTSSGTNTGDQTSVTGNAGTATALAANPTDCGANTFAVTIAANGNLTCASITDADVPNNITVDLATLASAVTNATLTTALTVNTGTVTLVGSAANTSVLTLGAGASSFSGTSSGTNTGDQTSVTGNAGTVTFADAAADTTTFVALGTSATGSLAPATDAGLTYNANTNALTATSFVGGLTGDVTGNLTGNVTGNVSGSSGSTTGNAATATALAANPTDCGANTFATTIAANGNLTCAAITDADVPNNITVDLATLASAVTNATLTTALTVNTGTVTLVGNAANTSVLTLGAGASSLSGSSSGTNTGDQTSVTGNAGTVTFADAAGDSTTFLALGTSATGSLAPATDAGLTYNATTDTLTTTTFVGALTGNVTGNVSGSSGSTTGNAATATALAANPTDCGANTFATTIAANGNLTCASISDADVPNNITVNLATLASTVTNATFTTALTVNTGTVTLTGNAANTSVLTIGAGAVSVSGTNTGDQTSVTGNAGTVTFADAAGDTTTFLALGTSATGSLAPATDAGLTYNSTTDALTTTTFIGALTGNASTATALAANPSDCGANTFATTIAANGNLTCASISDADVPNNITVDLATLASTVTFADAAADTTTFVALGTSATGSLAPATDAGLTYNANTNALTATTFIGALTGDVTGNLTGNVTGNVSGSSGSTTGNAATVTFADAGGDTTTFLALGTSATGSLAPATDAGLTYNSTTDALTTTTFIGALTGNASTATALAANPSDCAANTFATTIAANGNLTCASITDADVPNNITVDLATLASAVTNATLTTALTVNTGTVTLVGNAANTSVLTLGAGASSLSGSSSGTNTGDQTSVTGNAGTVTFADAGGDTTTFLALGTSATGSLAPATDAGLTYNSTTDALTTTTFIGALTGNASTASALAANPTDCGANTFATTIAANGNLTCASITDADVPNNITVDLATLASAVTNATLTTALTVNTGTVTLTGNAANTSVLTIGAGAVSVSGTNTGDQTSVTGNAGTVTFADAGGDTTTFLALGISATGSLAPATDAGLTYNATTDTLTTTTFVGALTGNVTGNVSGSSGSTTGNAATATALAANPSDCGANTFATTIAANGNLTCASITDADVPNSITVDLATLASAVTNATLTTALTVNTGTVTLVGNVANTSVLTIGAGAVSVSGTNTGDQTSVTGNAGTVTFADAAGDTTTFLALGTSATGSLAPATDAGLTYNATTDALTTTTFIGALTGNVTGNVSGSSGSTTGNAGTATALAANPSDCGANTFATTIAANGNLTCASITDADVPNSITVDLATLASAVTNATLTTALTVNTGTVTLIGNVANTSTLTLGVGASSLSGSSSGTNTGDQTSVTGNAGTVTFADAGGDTTTFLALGTSATGSLAPATDAGLSYNATTDTLSVSGAVNVNSLDRASGGALSLGTGNATSITIGSSSVTAITLTTDGTGTGEIVLPAGSIDGTEILNDTVALTTDTSGNYVASTSTSVLTGLTGGSAGSEGAALTLAFDYSQALSGDVALGANATVFGASGLAYEGATANTSEGYIVFTDPTADRTITIPDRSGTTSLSGDTFTSDVTGTLSSSGATALTVAADAVALTTDTTGNYVASTSTSVLTGLTGGSAGSEGATLTVAFDYSQALSGDVGLAANATVFGASGLAFEGATANTSEGYIVFTDPTADRTFTYPDRSGTLSLSGDTFTGDVTGTLSSSGATSLTVASDSVALTTDTTGNYVQSANTSVLTGLTGGSSGSEGAALTIAFDYSQALSGDPALAANAGVFGTNGLVFEGSTANTFETFIAITNPTADRTVTIPDRSGTTSLSGDTFTGDVTGTLNSSGATALTVASDSVALTTDTTGNYVASTSTSVLTGLTGGSAGSEGAALTLAFDYSQALSGDVALSANATVFGASGLAYEGATADTNEGYIVFTDPTADRTVTVPNSSGTIILSGHTFTSDVTATIGTGGTTALTIASDSVALGTDTTGNYVGTITNGLGISGSSATEGGTPTIALDETASLSGDHTLSANEEKFGLSGLIFEGATANAIETYFVVTDPTATDKTITFPDRSGTTSLSGDTFTGDVTGTLSASGATALTVASDSVALTTDTTGNYVASTSTSVLTGLTGGSAGSEGAALTLAFDYSQALSGDPALGANAGVFGASGLVFEGATANTFETFVAITDATADRTITVPDRTGTVSLSGDTFTSDVTGTLNSSGTTTLTVAADAVALGTDTTGNYVASTSTSVLTGLTGGSAGSEGAALTVAFDYSQALSGDVGLAANAAVFGQSGLVFEGSTANTSETYVAVTDATADRTITVPDASGVIVLSGHTFTSDVTATLGNGGTTALTVAADAVALTTDTTGNYVATVTGGAGLTGSGSTEGSTPTLAVVSGNGAIVANADDITFTVAPSANGLSSNTSSGSGLEVLSTGVALLQGCADTEILKWNETTDVWACAADATGGGGSSLDAAYNGGGTVTVDAYDVLLNLSDATNDYKFTIDNATNGTIATAFAITTAGGASSVFTTAVDLSDADIVTALALGSNDVTVGGATITSAEFALIDGGITNAELTDTGTLTVTTVDINGGAIDGTAIGASSASTGAFTTLSSTGATTIGNNSSTVAINSSDWDIDATGAMTNIGAITSDGLISTSGGLTVSAGNVAITDNSGTTWSISNAGVAAFGASATIAGAADGTDALILTAGDILVTDGDVDVSGGDFNVTLDAADGVGITATSNTTTTGMLGLTGTSSTPNNSGFYLSYTSNSGVSSSDVLTGERLYATQNDADGLLYGLTLENGNTSAGANPTQAKTAALLRITSGDITVSDGGVIDNGILFDTGICTPGTGCYTDGIDVSANGAFTTAAINLGSNKILGTSGVIDFTNFDVSSAGLITGAAGLTISAGDVALTDSTGTTWSISNAGVAALGASATVAGSADGTDAIIVTAGDILVTNGDLDLSGGDFNVVLDAADGVGISKGATTSVDVMGIVGGAVTDAAGLDALSISLTASDGTNRTNALINGSLTSAGTASGDVGIGLFLDLASVANAASTNKAIEIENTAAWDTDIELQNDETIDNVSDGVIALGATTVDVSGALKAGSSDVSLTLATGFIDADALTLVSAVDGRTGSTSASGLATYSDGLSLLQGCTDGQVLKWVESTDTWDCATVSGGTTAFDTIGDPTGNGAIAFGSTVQTLDWGTMDANASYLTYNFTNAGTSAGTDSGVVINNAVAGSATDSNTENLLLIQQLDTTAAGTTVVDNGLKIDVAGSSGMVDGIEITNSAGSISGSGLDIIDTAGGTFATGITLSGTFTTGIDMGSSILVNIGNSGTDFDSSGGLTLAGDATLAAGKDVRYTESGGGTDYVAFQAPAAVTSSVIWTLPGADAAGCFKSDGAGTMSISSCGDTRIQSFTASGTYTKASDALLVIVQSIGGGGGGGGGAGGSTAAARTGGGGGGGGTFVTETFAASELASTVEVTVGAAGTAGTAGSSAVGGNGGVGGDSCFSTAAGCTGTMYLRGYGGGAGAGSGAAGNGGGGGGGAGAVGAAASTLTGGAGGGPAGGAVGISNDGFGGGGGATAATTAAAGGSASWGGGGGGASTTAGGATSGAGGGSVRGGGAGGGGGSCTITTCTLRAGGAGGAVPSATSGTGAAGGATTGAAGVAGTASTVAGYGGGGGGGGANAPATTGGAGGAGATPGGAGGGGGAGETTTGGIGGLGARGEVRVWSLRGAGADLAEMYPTNDASLSPGDVVAIDPDLKTGVKKSGKAYDDTILGVISTEPGLVIGSTDGLGEKPVLVALSGRIPVKVTLENGPINIGDYLTASSTPGAAMKATKAGAIIGQALTAHETEGEPGYVMAFIKNGYSNGSKISSIMPGLTPVGASEDGEGAEVKSTGALALNYVIANKEALTGAEDISEVFADRVTAGLEVVTPTVLADEVFTNSLAASTGDVLAVNLGSEGSLVINNAEKEAKVTIDAEGNATFAGTITAEKIVAGSIEGLDAMAASLELLTESDEAQQAELLSLGSRLTTIESTPKFSVSGLSEFEGAVTVRGTFTALQGVFVDSIGSSSNLLTLLSDTVFIGRPYFNADTGGFAVVKKGSTEVSIFFDHEYLSDPVVNATVSFEGVGDDETTPEDESLLSDTREASYFAGDYRYIVIGKDTKGFTIRLNKPAEEDIRFSWNSLAIKGARTVISAPTAQPPVILPVAPVVETIPTVSEPEASPSIISEDAPMDNLPAETVGEEPIGDERETPVVTLPEVQSEPPVEASLPPPQPSTGE
jgi:hypothetical protein